MGEFARQAGAGEPLCQMAQGQAPFCKQGLSCFDGAAPAGSPGLAARINSPHGALIAAAVAGFTFFLRCYLPGVRREHMLRT